MTKKKLLKRIENIEKELVKSGVGYMQQTSNKGEPTKFRFAVFNINTKFSDITEKLEALAKSLGKRFRWVHIPQKNVDVVDIIEDTKKKK